MPYAKTRGTKRPFSATRARTTKRSGKSTYYDNQRKKTYGKYSAATLYKWPRAQSTTTRYFTVVKYLSSYNETDNINNQHIGNCLKSAVRAGDLVDCPLFEKMRFQYGAFKLEHVGATWTISQSNAPETDSHEHFAPIGFSSMIVQDYHDQTTFDGTVPGDTSAWLDSHDRRQSDHTTLSKFFDRKTIDINHNTKVHTMRPGSTSISRFFKGQKRFDQKGSFSLTAAGTTAEWTLDQKISLRTAINDKCKMSLLFFLPKAEVDCAVVCTFKCTMMGQPNFN